MSVPTFFPAKSLARMGLRFGEGLHYQTSVDELIQQMLNSGEGKLSDTGALVIRTGKFTGRAPKDKFIVRDELTEQTIDWNEFNNPIDAKYYHIVHKKMMEYLSTIPDLWIRDCYACADERYRINIRVVTEKPWISLFAHNMFLRPQENDLDTFEPQWHLFSAPDLQLNPGSDGVLHTNAVIVSFRHKTILIAGTGYTGETKKGIFSILNFILPHQKNVLGMHCSANMGEKGDTAVFFGLSGTGKTTLSADPNRRLIGDDEHGWTGDNLFNFEGGSYAKTIHLSEEREPQIFKAVRHGALVENVNFYPGTNKINFEDASITENTRVSYPLYFFPNALEPSVGPVPSNIFFLTCDAFGVLPPISLLTPVQAMYQFISGYTAKVAGTETGITEPKPTFSACYGAPFLPLHPSKYAEMFGRKIQQHKVNVWLVNTGWTGGSYGTGSRIKLSYTRAMISAALDGSLERMEMETEPVFNLSMPKQCPGVPSEILNPINTWKDKKAFGEKVNFVANLFVRNFGKYSAEISPEILAAAPKIY